MPVIDKSLEFPNRFSGRISNTVYGTFALRVHILPETYVNKIFCLVQGSVSQSCQEACWRLNWYTQHIQSYFTIEIKYV